MAVETEQSLHATKERDQALSQPLDRDNELTHLRLAIARVTSHMAELHSMYSAVSQDAINLTTELRS